MTPYALGLGLAWAFRMLRPTQPQTWGEALNWAAAACFVLPIAWVGGVAGMETCPGKVRQEIRHGPDPYELDDGACPCGGKPPCPRA
jgi:hypothetical protein